MLPFPSQLFHADFLSTVTVPLGPALPPTPAPKRNLSLQGLLLPNPGGSSVFVYERARVRMEERNDCVIIIAKGKTGRSLD